MQINVPLNKDFEKFLDKMKEEYGEDFEDLNSLSDKYLGFTTFIDNFKTSKTTADVSADGSSNVNTKDIVTLRSEMGKPIEKLLSYNKIFQEMKCDWGLRTAKKWFELEWNKSLYLHDANSATFIHYCYKGTNIITINYNNTIQKVTFEQLYSILSKEEPAEYDETVQQLVFRPKTLYVLDYQNDREKWVKVTRVLKHDNNLNMHFIKLANGKEITVTENHPIITTTGDKDAKNITIGDKVLTFKDNYFTNSLFKDSVTYLPKGHRINTITEEVQLNKDFGWLVGFILAEGSINRYGVAFGQKENVYLIKAHHILDELDIPYSVDLLDDDISITRLKTNKYTKWICNTFQNQCSYNKILPSNYIDYNFEFLNSLICGLIDGDGTSSSSSVIIRIASEALLLQINEYLSFNDIFGRFRVPTFNVKNDYSFDSTLPGFKLDISLRSEQALNIFSESIKVNNNYRPVTKLGNYANKQYNYTFGEVEVIQNVVLDYDCTEVYDITTDSGHFICNGILSHNCFAYDLKKIAEEGLFYLPDHNKPEPAQHLETFVDFVKEFISFTSNRSSGAVGLPNLIPYMYYYWNKDCKEGIHGLKVCDAEKFAKSEIQRIIYGMNQPYTRDGIQSAFINTSIFDDDYFMALFGGATFPDGEFMIDHQDGIMQFQRWFLEEMKAIKDRGRMFTFPVNTISLLVKDDEFANPEFAKWCSNHNRHWNDSNIFTDTEVTSLSNCCRLKSNVKDLGYFNSIGGSALKVGSIKVSTVNLARIAYECKGNRKKFLDTLEDRVVISLKMLETLRGILKSNVKKGLLNNFQDGIVDFEHLYNTIGINGIYETMKTFGYTSIDEFGNTVYSDNALEFGEQIFSRLHETLKAFTADKDYMANIEQVPAETAAVKFFSADKLLFPEDVITDLPLYGNQWIPLGIKTTLQERIRICAAFDKFCNGGSIMHLNVDAPFDSDEKAWDMLNYITKHGVTYFAFNGKLSGDDNGHLFYGDTCPECKSPKTSEYTRTVGFFTKTATWSKERKSEFKLRDWHPLNDKGIDG